MASLSECLNRFTASNAYKEIEHSKVTFVLEEETSTSVRTFAKGFLTASTTPVAIGSFATHLIALVHRTLGVVHPAVHPLTVTVALCRLAQQRPDLREFVEKRLMSLPCVTPLAADEVAVGDLSAEDLHLRLTAAVCYGLKIAWTVTDWNVALHHENEIVRWCGAKAISSILSLSDESTEHLCKKFDVPTTTSIACLIRLAQMEQTDHELSRAASEVTTAPTPTPESRKRPLSEDAEILLPSDFVKIAGVTVAASKRCTTMTKPQRIHPNPSFITTERIEECLFSAALALSQRKPLLLEGPPGSGKTQCIHELIRLTGNDDAIWIQIDDQMDSKSLLGAYVCTSTPGEFRWQPGPLAEAVSQGRWIIVEDINLAPSEVLASFIPLLENGMLTVPQRSETTVAQDGFHMIATVTCSPTGGAAGAYGSSDNIKDLLGGLFVSAVVKAPSLSEQRQILRNLFPEISSLLSFASAALFFVQLATKQRKLESMLDTDDGFGLRPLVERCMEKSGIEQSCIHVGRHFSLRDICKWCHRVLADGSDLVQRLKGMDTVDMSQLPFAFRHACLAECHDCYAALIPTSSLRMQLMVGFASLWCLTEEDVRSHMQLKKPLIKVAETDVDFGRARLPIQRDVPKAAPLFVHTGHAARLLEEVAVSLQLTEPVLLVGETGTGKTAMVQHIAHHVGAHLIVLNLSQQTDSSDLLGGYKPISPKDIFLPLINPFLDLLRRTWSKGNNEAFVSRVMKYAERRKWENLEHAFEVAVGKAKSTDKTSLESSSPSMKRQKKDLSESLKMEWVRFEEAFKKAAHFRRAAAVSFSFQFVEGTLLRALKNGYWLFLDEINLASPEALHTLAAVLETGPQVSLNLTDKGNVTVQKHPDFRLIGAMNPGTDFGKRDLSAPLRNKFTEFWVSEPEFKEDMEMIVSGYLSQIGPSLPVSEIVEFYIKAKEEAKGGLTDGAGQSPCYSLRTLCRFLRYIQRMIQSYGLNRVLLDGASAAFSTQLDAVSCSKMVRLIQKYLLRDGMTPTQLMKVPHRPPGKNVVLFEQFWLETGPEEIPQDGRTSGKQFVLTSSISENLKNLARAIALRHYPILLQGPTSSGKTTLVTYVAEQTGHKIVRINNHEHTDLQEYLGCYIADERGQLVFVEGALVQAVRKGYWVVLDELNLAPTEVLEALNRLLDDNRELYVPDLQQTIKPHPHFMLFATQNPPRHYSGRKHLSRAFRSRFLEINVDDIPDHELAEILEKRSLIPRSFATKMVAVMRELQRRRQMSNAFAGKHGFITPRDLFRWAERPADGYKQLAENGFFLLAERLRNSAEKQTVLEVLTNIMKSELDISHLYGAPEVKGRGTNMPLEWIPSTVRMFSLVQKCLEASESVLLIGDTGTGKTSVCQKLAEMNGQRLRILNCNLHTETSDFIGGFRPVRDRSKMRDQFTELLIRFEQHPTWSKHQIKMHSTDIAVLDAMDLLAAAREKEDALNFLDRLLVERSNAQVLSKKEKKKLTKDVAALSLLKEWMATLKSIGQSARMPFVWEDGVLVEAMRHGDMILIDELNLAEDAVLERMNSVLDPGRSLTLAEKGGEPPEVITAHPDFRIVATMNPGGDFGKKELSPALANRFTQIWVPPIEDASELMPILRSRFYDSPQKEDLVQTLMQFTCTFREWTRPHHLTITIRDLSSVVNFVNQVSEEIGAWEALIHGIAMVFLDGLELIIGSQGVDVVTELRKAAYGFLQTQLPRECKDKIEIAEGNVKAMPCQRKQETFCLGPFSIRLGPHQPVMDLKYDLSAPTPKRNAFRLLRAMQLKKSVLLEGSPGVGKTSLVSSLAVLTGHKLIRINLSEQTDMMDLLGADLPVPNGAAGEFRWCDGPLLTALKTGSWVLLDELNLANQQILEGLNALTDHRAEVFIPELNATFSCPATFRLFASQNPSGQGGGRKGLPKSFLNRFTRVYTEAFDEQDMRDISEALCAHVVERSILFRMVQFLNQVNGMCANSKLGVLGGPWEFNLRDFLRWESLLEETQPADTSSRNLRVMKASEVLFFRRFRTAADTKALAGMYRNVFGVDFKYQHPGAILSDQVIVIGDRVLPRSPLCAVKVQSDLFPLPHLAPFLESLAICVERNWPALVVGPTCSGKTCLVRSLAVLCNRNLVEITLTSGTDASDFLGGFEKFEFNRDLRKLCEETEAVMRCLFCRLVKDVTKDAVSDALRLYDQLMSFVSGMNGAFLNDTEKRKSVVAFLLHFCEDLTSFIHHRSTLPKMHAGLERLSEKLRTAVSGLETSTDGCFEWVDGAFVEAMEKGDWVLLDNANLCSPTVLDRLNSVMEPNGVLNLNECGGTNGEPRVVRPHVDFRLFLAYDPKHGEISRAMRNRSIETYLPHEISVAGRKEANSGGSVNLSILLSSARKMDDRRVTDMLTKWHEDLTISKSGSGQLPTIRDLSQALCVYKFLTDSGSARTAAIRVAHSQIYGQSGHRGNDGSFPVVQNQELDVENVDGCVADNSDAALYPNWLLRRLTIHASVDSSLFSSVCREMVILSPDDVCQGNNPETRIATRVIASRMSSRQLEHIQAWAQSFNLDGTWLMEFFDHVMSKELARRFVECARQDERRWKLLPFDSSYWNPLAEDGDKVIDSDIGALFLRLCQFQCQCAMSCKKTNSERLRHNSMYQLAYIRSLEPHFLPNLKNIRPEWLEWISPTFTVLQELVGQSLGVLRNHDRCSSPHEITSVGTLLSYIHHFWDQWNSRKPTDTSVQAFLESTIYLWIKIKKLVSILLTSLVPPDSSLVARWKMTLDGMDDALELPAIHRQKPLLWKYGGHPRQHSTQKAAEDYIKLYDLCCLFGIEDVDRQEDLHRCKLLQELHLFEESDEMDIDVESGENGSEDHPYMASLLGLVSDCQLRRTLLGALSIASLAAYSYDQEAEPSDVVCEALRLTLEEVDVSKTRLVNGSRTSVEASEKDGFQLFLPATLMQSSLCRDMQMDLRNLHWTVHCNSSVDFILPLLLSHSGVEESSTTNITHVCEELTRRIEDGVERSLLPMSHYGCCQDVLWLLEATQKETDGSQLPAEYKDRALSLIGNVVYRWMHSLVATCVQLRSVDHLQLPMIQSSIDVRCSGSALLFEGRLTTAVEILTSKPSTILNAPRRMMQLKLATRHLFCGTQGILRSSQQVLADMRFQIAVLLTHIVAVHRISLPEQNRHPVQQLLQQFCHLIKRSGSGDDVDTLQHLLRCLRFHVGHSDHEGLKFALDRFLLPCCQLVVKLSSCDSPDSVANLGKAWILLGLVRMSLTLPPVGVDPATKHRFKAQHLAFVLSHELEPELSVRTRVQCIPGGVDETTKIDGLVEAIARTEEKQEDLQKLTVSRPEPSLYLDVHQRIIRFLSSHGDTTRIEELVKGLEDQQSDSLGKAEHWIDVSSRFIDETTREYSLYSDILQPFSQGILEVCHGLSAMMSSVKQQQSHNISQFVVDYAEQLMSICPDTSVNSLVERKALEEMGKLLFARLLPRAQDKNLVEGVVFEVQLCCLHAALYTTSVECIRARDTPSQAASEHHFCTIAENLMYVFEKLEAFHESKAEEEAQVFRTKTQTVRLETDEDVEEASYKAMFPDHRQDFADLEVLDLDELPSATQAMATDAQAHSSRSQSLMGGAFLEEIVLLHRRVFERTATSDNDAQEFKACYKVAQMLLKVLDQSVSRSFDERTLTGHLYHVCEIYKQLSKKPVVNSKQQSITDFEKPCVEEVLLTHQCILPLQTRLEALLLDWPDNPILAQLREICMRILSSSITTTVKKILTGLELLLAKAQIWEDTASSAVSISAELKQIAGLAVRWQRMELESWNTILERLAMNHAAGANKTWFYILRILSSAHTTLKSEDVMSAIEEYLTTATLGEFSERLSILKAFQCQWKSLHGGSRITHVLKNLVTLYAQYEPLVESCIKDSMKEIEKEIQEFVKLQKWEDRGYYSMKKTAERAQRKLHKLCRRGEEVLKRPAAAVLAQISNSVGYKELDKPRSVPITLTGIQWNQPILPNCADLFSQLCEKAQKLTWNGRCVYDLMRLNDRSLRFSELPRITAKMADLSQSAPSWNALRDVNQSVEDVCSSVLSRVHELQQEKSRASRARKKKALSDFMKLLQELGVSKRKSDIPKDKQTVASWFDQPTLDWSVLLEQSLLSSKMCASERQTVAESVGKADSYYYKCIDRMQRIWNSMNCPSKDVALSEAQAMSNSAEHFLFLLHSQRDLLSVFLTVHPKLESSLSHLRQISHRPVDTDPAVFQSMHTEAMDLWPPLPPQSVVQDWLGRQWTMLERLGSVVASSKRLLQNMKDVEDNTVCQELLTECLHQAGEYEETVSRCCSSLQEMQTRSKRWMSYKDEAVLIQNYRTIMQMNERMQARHKISTDPEQLAKIGLHGVVFSEVVPSWRELTSAIECEAKSAAILLQALPVSHVPPDEITENEIVQIHNRLEHCLTDHMLWIQAQHGQQSLAASLDTPETSKELVPNILDVCAWCRTCFGFDRLSQIHSDISHLLQELSDMSEVLWNKTVLGRASKTATETVCLLSEMLAGMESAAVITSDSLMRLAVYFLDFHQKTSKLCYVAMNLVLGLLVDGFCTEPEGDPEEGDGKGEFEEEEGTGMADGEGRKDVSEEIENEDQITGTRQSDEKEKDEDQQPQESKGIEMEEDFDGRYENTEREEDRESEGASSEGRLDDEMGKVGAEGETVDERLWGEEDAKDEEQTQDEPAQSETEGRTSEYADGRLDGEEDSEKQRNKKPQEKSIDREGSNDEEETDDADGEESEGEGPPQPGFTKPEQSEDELQLSDDMKLDGEECDDKDSLKGSENDDHLPETEEPPIQTFAEPEREAGNEEHAKDTSNEPEDTSEEDEKAAEETERQTDIDESSEKGTTTKLEQSDDDQGSISSREEAADIVPDERDVPDPGETDGTRGDPTGPSQEAATAGYQEGDLSKELAAEEQQAAVPSRVEEVMEHYEAAPQSGPSAMGSCGGGVEGLPAPAEKTDQHDNKKKSANEKQSANPMRRLGDALEEWKSQLSVLDTTNEGRSQVPEVEATQNTSDAMEYEFVQQEDASATATQALGAATEEQARQMTDPRNESIQQPNEAEPEVEAKETEELAQQIAKASFRTTDSTADNFDAPVPDNASETQMEVDENPIPGEVDGVTDDRDPNKESYISVRFRNALFEDGEELEKEDPEREGADLVIEQFDHGRELVEGQQVWNRCQAATHALTSELTEHLRLILEPTLASRLAGDYRTGKRINMKRVIPYVASQFRKDKIWLRRTKPDKRMYQVILAVDDSKSMSENGCGTFALEALTLLSRSMSRLEIGELGLVSFGGSGKLSVLHPLGTPFSDSNGPSIVSMMHFDQDNRIEDQPMVRLVQCLQEMLDIAERKHPSTTANSQQLHQLVVIVADGRFHERTELKRRAHELCNRPGVLVSFIVIDNPQHSLLNLSTVCFEGGRPQFQNYLDDFPFPCYIVVSDITSLPRTMADLLRQWFQLSAATH